MTSQSEHDPIPWVSVHPKFWKTSPANFEQTCVTCFGPIYIGNKITAERGPGYEHFECGKKEYEEYHEELLALEEIKNDSDDKYCPGCVGNNKMIRARQNEAMDLIKRHPNKIHVISYNPYAKPSLGRFNLWIKE